MKVPELSQLPPTVNDAVGGAINVPIVNVKSFAKSILGSLVFAVIVGVPAPLLVISRLLVTASAPERSVYVGVPDDGRKRRL